MTTRGRSLSVLLLVLAGGLGVIASTQTWFLVTITTAAETIEVSGAAAVPLLAPLSLTALALAGVIAIAGRLLRYVFAGVAALIAAALFAVTLPLLPEPPLSAVAGVVTELTGLGGETAVASMVQSIDSTAWPAIAIGLWGLLLLAAVFIAATAHRWRAGGKRFRTDTQHDTGPVDTIESWDDLSRGSDPTHPDR